MPAQPALSRANASAGSTGEANETRAASPAQGSGDNNNSSPPPEDEPMDLASTEERYPASEEREGGRASSPHKTNAGDDQDNNQSNEQAGLAQQGGRSSPPQETLSGGAPQDKRRILARQQEGERAQRPSQKTQKVAASHQENKREESSAPSDEDDDAVLHITRESARLSVGPNDGHQTPPARSRAGSESAAHAQQRNKRLPGQTSSSACPAQQASSAIKVVSVPLRRAASQAPASSRQAKTRMARETRTLTRPAQQASATKSGDSSTRVTQASSQAGASGSSGATSAASSNTQDEATTSRLPGGIRRKRKPAQSDAEKEAARKRHKANAKTKKTSNRADRLADWEGFCCEYCHGRGVECIPPTVEAYNQVRCDECSKKNVACSVGKILFDDNYVPSTKTALTIDDLRAHQEELDQGLVSSGKRKGKAVERPGQTSAPTRPPRQTPPEVKDLKRRLRYERRFNSIQERCLMNIRHLLTKLDQEQSEGTGVTPQRLSSFVSTLSSVLEVNAVEMDQEDDDQKAELKRLEEAAAAQADE